jgi:hypothetical protein
MSRLPTPAAEPPAPVRLFVLVVAIAVVLTVTVAYLGLSGRLGLGIPGEKPPPSNGSSGQLRVSPPGPGPIVEPHGTPAASSGASSAFG